MTTRKEINWPPTRRLRWPWTVDHAIRMRDAARRFRHLGFTLAEPLSFGRRVDWPDSQPSTELAAAA
ncbi:MAG: hypothetical protein QM619_12330 [Micropruina sp.]|uniref:hypothetical protein n=1 Tax=Micropruina sp. TaxID=2737536 RepID=UPI0039E242A3